MGRALEMEALAKLTTKGSSDMQPRMLIFLHHGKFRGSAGSVDG